MHIKRMIRSFLDFLLPTSCSYCRSRVGSSPVPFFCAACWSDFSLIQGPVCPQCGRPFDSSEALAYSPAHLCGSCRQAPPQYDQALSAGQFEGPLREAVHVFKYRPCRALGSHLGAWMAGAILLEPVIDAVMPVPLHSTRLRERGFNQALLLAHALCKAHGLTLSFDNLNRIRPTRPQVELSGEERVANVAGAFALRRPGEVSGRTVLLIDDVHTTGATLNECARVLKKAGAARVMALTLARAV